MGADAGGDTAVPPTGAAPATRIGIHARATPKVEVPSSSALWHRLLLEPRFLTRRRQVISAHPQHCFAELGRADDSHEQLTRG